MPFDGERFSGGTNALGDHAFHAEKWDKLSVELFQSIIYTSRYDA